MGVTPQDSGVARGAHRACSGVALTTALRRCTNLVKFPLGALGPAPQLCARLLEHLGAGFQYAAQLGVSVRTVSAAAATAARVLRGPQSCSAWLATLNSARPCWIATGTSA